MSYLANRFTVVLDACVLYPARKRDLLLTFGELGLCRARWTKEIEEEWSVNLKVRFPEKVDKIAELACQMNEAFPEAMVSGHNGLADHIHLPDLNDRHVLGAAIKCGAQIIVTDNLKHFPKDLLAPLDIEALSADQFLATTADLFRTESIIAMRKVRAKLKKKAYSPSQFLMDLTAKGMPLLAANFKDMRDLI